MTKFNKKILYIIQDYPHRWDSTFALLIARTNLWLGHKQNEKENMFPYLWLGMISEDLGNLPYGPILSCELRWVGIASGEAVVEHSSGVWEVVGSTTNQVISDFKNGT